MMTVDAVEAVRVERKLKLLTASRAKDARGCKRLHHLQYDLGYRPIEDAADLRFGTLIHLGLEAWWRAKQVGKPDEAWLAEANAVTLGGDCDPFDAARAQVLLTGYHLRWKDEPFEVLAVEVRFNTELRNPETGFASRTWRLSGKIDVVVRDLRDGLVYLIEHKTSSESLEPGSDYFKRLRMDGQISVYFDGGAALGYDVAGCIYDVIGKPQQRPSGVPVTDEHGNKVVHNAKGERVRTAQGKWRQTGDSQMGYVLQTRPETPEEHRDRVAAIVGEDPNRFFARVVVVRLDADLEDARYDLWQLAGEIHSGQLAGRFPRNPDHCIKYGRTCPFFSVCAREAALESNPMFHRLSDVHPELAGDAAEPNAERAGDTA